MIATTLVHAVAASTMLAAPWIVGHRGAGSESRSNPYPENTLPSIRAAFLQGADMVEIDVVLDRNGVPILWHDRHIEVDGRRELVRELALSELPVQEGPTGIRAPIPTFWDALRLALYLGRAQKVMDVEIKVHDEADRDELVATIAGVLVEQGAVNRVLISSIDLEALNVIEAMLPGIESGYIAILLDRMHTLLTEGEYPIEWLLVQHRWRVNSASQQALVERGRANGIRIGAWTVNHGPRIRELADSGYELIITDKPAVARAVLGPGYSHALAWHGPYGVPHGIGPGWHEGDVYFELDEEPRYDFEFEPAPDGDVPSDGVELLPLKSSHARPPVTATTAVLPRPDDQSPKRASRAHGEPKASGGASTAARVRELEARFAERRRPVGPRSTTPSTAVEQRDATRGGDR